MPPQQQYQTPAMPASSQMSHGKRLGLLIPFILVVLALIACGVFAVWAFSSRQDYKNNSDKKSAAAVQVAIQKEDSKKDAEFVEKEKSPFKTFTGPETYGNIQITYPKTWSAYVVQKDGASFPLDAYLHPDFVSDVTGGTAFALRIQVLNQSYDQVLKTLEAGVKAGKLSVSAYKPVKVPNITGSRAVGQINAGQKDDMIILPLRDKTIEIYTESQEFENDFSNTILPNLVFSP